MTSKIRTIFKKIAPSFTLRLFYWLKKKRQYSISGWNKFIKDKDVPIELQKMLMDHRFHVKGEVSKIWIRLGNKHLRQLLNNGYDNFKQTIALRYFVFARSDRSYHQLDFLMNNLDRETIKRAELNAKNSKLPNLFDHREALNYNLLTFLLWEYVKKLGLKGRNLSEPLQGNPPSVLIGNLEISQDLLSSLLEFDSVIKCIKEDSVKTVLEVGAGYGRDAFVFLKLIPGIRYVIVDIPPALYISQRYLSNEFSDYKIFKYRDFGSYEQIKDEFNESQIAFLMPWQLKMLPRKSIDIFLSIDALHEMMKSTIKNYFLDVDRITRGHFYFKCCKDTKNTIDGVYLKEKDYPIFPEWKKIFSRECRVQVTYFEALYDLSQC